MYLGPVVAAQQILDLSPQTSYPRKEKRGGASQGLGMSLPHQDVWVRSFYFYLPPGLRCVRAWVTQFSLKLLQLHIFGKLLVLMNFYALQYFGGLVNFGLLLSE